jgi:hypothetical protein
MVHITVFTESKKTFTFETTIHATMIRHFIILLILPLFHLILFKEHQLTAQESDAQCNSYRKVLTDLIIGKGEQRNIDFDFEFQGNKIVIEVDALLIISGTAFMNPNAQLLVECGGKLILDGGTLTGLDNEMWRGIEVWGNPTLSSTESNQGSFFVINGGTIENAIVGIRTAKTVQDEESETIDLSFSGGIVKVSDGRFVNNRTAIYFYKYPAAGYSHQYSGIIMNNTSFETNDDYDGSTFPRYFIYMNDISRVTLTACTFLDNTSQQIKQSGVYSFNSQFIIKGSTSGGSGYNSNFKKLNFGVYALASTPNRFPDISHTGFEDNQKGIYFSGISHAQVNYCNFTTSAGQTGSYGLYLDGCRNYWAEGNEFSNAGPSNLFGIYVNDTRPTGPEMIYRNNFMDMHVGIMALNRNRTRSGEGLVLKCNEYVNTDWNQVVYFKDILLTPEVGIAQNQGSADTLPDAPAGNRFSWTGPIGTPTDINNQANHITYYYHVDPLVKLKPEYYTESTVDIVANPQAFWDPQESCPPNLDPGGGGSGGGGLDDSDELRLLIASSEQQADSVGQLIQSLEDAGDTPGLTWTVDMSAPNQAYEVYNQLMGAAPYVSDTVMAAAIQKETVMVDAMIRDVMVANPESAKDDDLLELLNERFSPLPEYMLGQILQGRSLVSVYGELKSKQSYWHQQRSLAMNRLKVNYLADTTNPGASLDTLAMLLGEENTADARYQLAMLHVGRNNWTDAMAVLSTIPQYFTLGQDGLQSHQDMVSFMGVLQQMDGSLPDSTQAATLFGLIGQEAGKAPVYARNILIAAGLLAYEEPVIFPDPYKSSKEIEFERLVKLADEQRMIEVFPNPAGTYFIVKWEVEKPADNMEVRLTSSTGQAVMQIPVSGRENQQIVPTHGIKAGVYVVSLHAGGKILDSVKITIVH